MIHFVVSLTSACLGRIASLLVALTLFATRCLRLMSFAGLPIILRARVPGLLGELRGLHIVSRYNADNSHLPVDNGKVLNVAFPHDSIGIGRILVGVTKVRIVTHRVTHPRRARVVAMSSGLPVWIWMIDHANQFLILHDGPRVGLDGAHAVSRSLDGVSRAQRAGLLYDDVLQFFRSGLSR